MYGTMMQNDLHYAGEMSVREVTVSAEASLVPQGEGERQIVVFTFAGEITQEQVTEWNARIRALKQMFGTKLVGAVIKGEKSLDKR
jgi:hypothetical protein